MENSSKIKWKGSTLLAPVPPVMVTCGDMENSNIITIAWTGIVNTHPPMTYISVRPSRHSYELIKESGEFAINLVPKELVKKADFCGIYTGKKVNKFEKCGFGKQKATEVACPLIKESPMSLECKVKEIIPLGTHDMFLAEIVAVDVEPELLDEKGKLRLDRARLTAFAHGEYFEIGKKIDDFGCSVKAKKSKGKKDAPKGKKASK